MARKFLKTHGKESESPEKATAGVPTEASNANEDLVNLGRGEASKTALPGGFQEKGGGKPESESEQALPRKRTLYEKETSPKEGVADAGDLALAPDDGQMRQTKGGSH
jgi:hypothetical protein